MIIVIVAGVAVYFCKKNNNSNNENGQTEQQENAETSLIDMNNTENAKIEDGIKQNTSENVLRDRDLNKISITGIQLLAQEGISNFTATVTNNTGKDFAGGVAKVKFTNQDGSEYAELEVYVPEMKAGATNSINAGTTADIINAYDFTIELEK